MHNTKLPNIQTVLLPTVVLDSHDYDSDTFYLDDVASPLWPWQQLFALTLATNSRFALHLSTMSFTIVLFSCKYACSFLIKSILLIAHCSHL